jgi:hypothetical protein
VSLSDQALLREVPTASHEGKMSRLSTHRDATWPDGRAVSGSRTPAPKTCSPPGHLHGAGFDEPLNGVLEVELI